MFVFASILNSVLRNALHSRGESPNLNMKTGVDERSLRENSFDTITAKQTNKQRVKIEIYVNGVSKMEMN